LYCQPNIFALGTVDLAFHNFLAWLYVALTTWLWEWRLSIQPGHGL